MRHLPTVASKRRLQIQTSHSAALVAGTVACGILRLYA